MADLVGVFAASHGPIIARDWDKMPAGTATSSRPASTRSDAGSRPAGRTSWS